MAKESFVLYKGQYEPIKNLSIEDKGLLLDAIFEYQITGNTKDLSPLVSLAFGFFKNQFDLDNIKYLEKCRKNAENGKKGGKRTQANAIERERIQAFQADNDNDNDNDLITCDEFLKKWNSIPGIPTRSFKSSSIKNKVYKNIKDRVKSFKIEDIQKFFLSTSQSSHIFKENWFTLDFCVKNDVNFEKVINKWMDWRKNEIKKTPINQSAELKNEANLTLLKEIEGL